MEQESNSTQKRKIKLILAARLSVEQKIITSNSTRDLA